MSEQSVKLGPELAVDRPSTWAILGSVSLIVVVSALFPLVPGLDLWFSGLFYTPGQGFLAADSQMLQLFRKSNDYAVTIVAILPVVHLVARIFWPKMRWLMQPSHAIFMLSSLVVGPGLIVNTILKNNWGRPRPDAITAFGGSAPYVPIWHVSDYCQLNCSFPAGEGAAAMWLVSLAFVVPRPWRMPVGVATTAFAALLSLNRIAFGRHFLSDVLLSWGITLLVMAIMWRIFVESPSATVGNERLKAGLAAFGRKLRGAA